MTRNTQRAAWILATISTVFMTLVIAHGFLEGNFREEGRWLVEHPWGRVTLVDLYVGFALFGGWVVARETMKWVAVPWILSILLLGHWAASVYVIRALLQSRGDTQRFWMGDHAVRSTAETSSGPAPPEGGAGGI